MSDSNTMNHQAKTHQATPHNLRYPEVGNSEIEHRSISFPRGILVTNLISSVVEKVEIKSMVRQKQVECTRESGPAI
ncbi:hypothetical protein WAI453_011417 [Rhynchosporium graminicola]